MSDMSEEDILSSQISNILLSNETVSDEMQFETIKTSGVECTDSDNTEDFATDANEWYFETIKTFGAECSNSKNTEEFTTKPIGTVIIDSENTVNLDIEALQELEDAEDQADLAKVKPYWLP